MKILLVISIFALTSAAAFSQTKEIAFKSHSGSSVNFDIAMELDLFSPENSDFGMAPTSTVTEAQLDSVIFVSDSTAYMITSRYCKDRYRAVNDTSSTFWRAGKELVFKHPLFSHQHSLDSIKKILQTQYYFRNKIDKVIFIGYDNQGKPCEQNNVEPVTVAPVNSQSPFGNEFIGILSCIVGFSLVGAWVSWKYSGQG